MLPLIVAATLGAAVSTLAWPLSGVLVAGIATVCGIVWVLPRYSLPTLVASLVMLASGLVDLPRDVKVGSLTFLGMLTVVYLVLTGFVLLLRGRVPAYVARVTKPLLFFLGWAALSLLWSPLTTESIQNVLALTSFVVLVYLGATAAYQEQSFTRSIMKVLNFALWISLFLYGLGVLKLGVIASAINTKYAVSPRSFVLFGLLVLSMNLAAVDKRSRKPLLNVVVLLIAIVSSLSRAAMVVAFVLIPLSRLKPGHLGRGIVKLTVAAGMTVMVFAMIFLTFKPLQDRFVRGDVRSVGSTSISLNFSGRYTLWTTTWDSYLDSPWVGHGAGSSQALVRQFFVELDHPHNDYLRILHDYGAIGFAFFLFAFGLLLHHTWRGRSLPSEDRAAFHRGAFLCLAGVLFAMITDNPLAYVFVLAPLGLLVGASLGATAAELDEDAAAQSTEAGLRLVEVGATPG